MSCWPRAVQWRMLWNQCGWRQGHDDSQLTSMNVKFLKYLENGPDRKSRTYAADEKHTMRVVASSFSSSVDKIMSDSCVGTAADAALADNLRCCHACLPELQVWTLDNGLLTATLTWACLSWAAASCSGVFEIFLLPTLLCVCACLDPLFTDVYILTAVKSNYRLS